MHELIALVRENNIPMRNGLLLNSQPHVPHRPSLLSVKDTEEHWYKREVQ